MAFLAALSASSLHEMLEWLGIHWIKMKEVMELIVSWIEEMHGFNDKKVADRNLPFLQMRMVTNSHW